VCWWRNKYYYYYYYYYQEPSDLSGLEPIAPLELAEFGVPLVASLEV
jgi:hypothetical protein